MIQVSKDTQERISRLRQQVLVTPEVCVEKARYMTQSYKETEGEPSYYRRAKALEWILRNITVSISDDELIVGRVTSKARGGALSPEINCRWYVDQLELLSERPSDRFRPIPEETKQEIKEIVAYWEGKSLCDYWHETVSEEAKKLTGILFNGGSFCCNTQYYGHITVQYEKVLRLGISGIRKEVEEAQSRLDPDKDAEKTEYLNAMKIALNSAVILAHRYGDLAKKMAEEECSEKRRAELLQIEKICRKVPEFPAETFREAIQSTWFVYMAVMIESWGAGPSLDSIDKYLYPYYEKDMEKGILSDEEAFLLISMFFVKCNEQLTIYHTDATKTFGGMSSRVSVNLGGKKADGTTAVNPLSYLFLEAERIVACGEDMVVQVDSETPEDFLILAVEVARDVHGKIKFVGDEVIAGNLISYGIPAEKVHELVVTGCNTMGIPGVTLEAPGGILNLPLLLDLALYNGYSHHLGIQLGPETGNAAKFTGWEDVFDAFKAQFEYFLPYIMEIRDKDKALYGKYMPAPFQSALYDTCIAHGTDVMNGPEGVYMAFGISLAGLPNVGDALETIKEAVFKENLFTMDTLLKACMNNFEGYDDILHLINKLPKFGNDMDEVDDLVNQVLTYCSDKVAEYPGYLGARSTVAAATITADVPHGQNVGAQPDGRRAGEPIAEGGISPHQGRNQSGATSTFRSVAKLNHQKLGNGSVLNMRFDPAAVDSEIKVRKLADLVRTFHMMGGFLVQFNIVSTETLRAAQRNPEDYKDLIVRVATYSAYFIELSRELQEDIISRLEFMEV
ncbi:MAG: glycyl radical protein [Anaerovoracaceae bacterium]